VVATGLRKTFDPLGAPVRALRGAEVIVEAGEFVAITGPSGSGKSTLLSVLAGLDVPDEGSVTLAGHDLFGTDDDGRARLRRHHVGFIYQFFNLLDDLTALENVALAALAAGRSRQEASEAARQYLDLLGLLDKAAVSPAALSGGHRQRLAIARALVNRPTILLADEPTGALDSEGEAEVLELLSRLNGLGQAMLLVTHSDRVAAGADRVLHFRDGAVAGPDEGGRR
jgi:putative ABC transport system ATP-binding protein